MKYFLYRMQSDATAPNGGDFRSWFHFYKWGRSEVVTLRKPAPYFEGVQRGDVLFFVLDGLLIGDGLIEHVRNGVYITGVDGPVQEIDIAEKGIWEYLRPWSFWDQCLDRVRLQGLDQEVPLRRALSWLALYRSYKESPSGSAQPRGRLAVYDPDHEPPFFAIKKK